MKTNYPLLLLFLIFGMTTNLFSQNNAPIAVNDTIYVNSGGEYIYCPTLNDYDPDGDSFKIWFAHFKNHSGNMIRINDDSLKITMNYTAGLDTIRYRLRDSKGKMSNIAYIFVHINLHHTIDTLNINNISVPFYPFGNGFWNYLAYLNLRTQSEFPKGSGKTTIFSSSPWVGALDQANKLHIAAEKNRGSKIDFYYGPVCDSSLLSQHSDSLWNRVWKINKAEIEYHKNNYWKSSYTVPEAIANWPAAGDATLGQNAKIAPFIDNNNDGQYTPSDGDYPKIRGDQSVFLIFNDTKGAHTNSGGLPMGIEVHQWAYAYDCAIDTALNHTMFVHYDIYNRSSNNYHNVYLGMFTDFDIGYSYDDYIACDSTRNLYYAYNAHDTDGLGNPSHYGANPPAQGIVFLSDTMRSFMQNRYSPAFMNPTTDTAYYNFMQAIWLDGTHLTYGGNGHASSGNTGIPTNFLYSGNPQDTTDWTEYQAGNPAGGRNGVGSIGAFSLASGAVKSIDIAYVYARDMSKNNIENISVLKNAVDKIQFYYDNDTTPCGGSFSAIAKPHILPNQLRVYPNPTNNHLFIEYLPQSDNAKYEVFNIQGKLLKTGHLLQQKQNRINLTNYKSGLYLILISDGSKLLSTKFIVR